MIITRLLRPLLSAIVIGSHGLATAAAGLPCSFADVQPSFPALNALPTIQTSDKAPPQGAHCFTSQDQSSIWITVASVIETAQRAEDIIRRFGAISELLDVQYWSTFDHGWRPMVSTAFAVASAGADQARADYSSTELAGISRYYRVTDTRTNVPVSYRMVVHPSPNGQILVETSNVDPITKWGITLYRPDGVHTVYILSERSPGVWAYYSITRGVPASFLAKGHAESYINRAVALYRHYMRLPTAAEPPAAR